MCVLKKNETLIQQRVHREKWQIRFQEKLKAINPQARNQFFENVSMLIKGVWMFY